MVEVQFFEEIRGEKVVETRGAASNTHSHPPKDEALQGYLYNLIINLYYTVHRTNSARFISI